jgi:hypothetical protein
MRARSSCRAVVSEAISASMRARRWVVEGSEFDGWLSAAFASAGAAE